ncbi:MAG: ribonuclease HII [Bacteroidales bacterium]
MLKSHYSDGIIEAGCDEAGRGCLAGPVFAAAVILPYDYRNSRINDSKKLSAAKREDLRREIEKDSLAWCVASADHSEIDKINILNASILSMHRALDGLKLKPGLLLIDGNRFKPYQNIEHKCIIRGDSCYLSIAAASILAKTYRDEFMVELSQKFPQYGWSRNKGYPTSEHRNALLRLGYSPYHRRSFVLKEQLLMF